MPATRKSPRKLAGPGAVFVLAHGTLFTGADLDVLAEAAGLQVVTDDYSRLASSLNRAFWHAHAFAGIVKDAPTAGELREAYAAAAAAGKAFLLALGLDDCPAALAGM